MRSGLILSLYFAVRLAVTGAQVTTGPAPLYQNLAGGLSEFNGRLDAGRPDSRQVIADASRLVGNYRALAPYVGGFGRSDFAQNRLLAGQAFGWLARAGQLYASDPAVLQALAAAYGYLGGFYGNPAFAFYPYAAATAFSGANRLTRAMLLRDPNNARLEAELQRVGMQWAAASYVGGRIYGDGLPDQPEPPPPGPSPEPQPIALPELDASQLGPDQAALWPEVRQTFVATAARVQHSQVLLQQLADRLRTDNMSLNPRDIAASLMMEGFLEDAAALIRAGRLDLAKQALVRAEYQRRKLKDVTGG